MSVLSFECPTLVYLETQPGVACDRQVLKCKGIPIHDMDILAALEESVSAHQGDAVRSWPAWNRVSRAGGRPRDATTTSGGLIMMTIM